MTLPSTPLIVQCPHCRKMGADEIKEKEGDTYKLILVRCQSCKRKYLVLETYTSAEGISPGYYSSECHWDEIPLSFLGEFTDDS